MRRIVTQPPVEEAITLAQAVEHLRVEQDDLGAAGEAHVLRLIRSARDAAEGELNRPLLPQTCVVLTDSIERRTRLWNDVSEIVSVSYRDLDGAEQTLPLAQCTIERGRVLVVSSDLPAYSSSVRVTFKCGAWPDVGSVPESIINWMLLQVGSLYEVRQGVTQGETFAVPSTFTRLLIQPYVVEEI